MGDLSSEFAPVPELSRDFHDHQDLADGQIYPARHDDDQFSIALLERASDKLDDPNSAVPWIDTGSLLEAILDRHGIALFDNG